MHATDFELELFVSAQLDDARAQELEAHCEGCARCAEAVTREARLELAVRAMAAERRCGMRADVVAELPVEAEVPAPVSRPRWFGFAAVACVLLAFAAARLPKPGQAAMAPSQELFVDAGDWSGAGVARPSVQVGVELSGGTP